MTAERIHIETDAGELDEYKLLKFVRSNQGTCINQRPIVNVGDRIADGQPLADSSSTQQGELALGRNILVAFMSWEGGNYEDAIVISDRLVRDDLFTSIHIEKHEMESRDKLGPEEITRDIERRRGGPRTSTRRGSSTSAPRSPRRHPGRQDHAQGRDQLTLLRAIFGEGARGEGLSLRLPHGERARSWRSRVPPRVNDDLQAGEPPGPASVAQKAVSVKPAATATRASSPRCCPRGHAVPAGRHPGRHRPQPARRAEPHGIGGSRRTPGGRCTMGQGAPRCSMARPEQRLAELHDTTRRGRQDQAARRRTATFDRITVGRSTCSSSTTWSRTRSTRGRRPGSLITGSPGGKAVRRQRFGEMEVGTGGIRSPTPPGI